MRRIPIAYATVIALMTGAPAVALGICVEGTYPPFSETRPDGTIVGFDIDMANALCDRIGETCEMVRTDWTRMIPSLIDGRCDAIIASMSDTPERRLSIDFTDRYYRAPVRFVGPEGAELSDAPDLLAGKVVGVQRGTVNQTFMSAHYPAAVLSPTRAGAGRRIDGRWRSVAKWAHFVCRTRRVEEGQRCGELVKTNCHGSTASRFMRLRRYPQTIGSSEIAMIATSTNSKLFFTNGWLPKK
jgi:hypothetical protein